MNVWKNFGRFGLYIFLLGILIPVRYSYSVPLLDNRNLGISVKLSLSPPLKGKFVMPFWSASGSYLLAGRSLIHARDGNLEEKEQLNMEESLSPFGFNSEAGRIYALRGAEDNNDICLYDIKMKSQRTIPLPIRKSWRKIRIIDPRITPEGEILAVFQKETDDNNVKECYIFTMNDEGKSFKQLTDNSIYLVKSKFLFMGKKVSYGRLRFPVISNNGKALAYLALTNREPGKFLFDLCVQPRNENSFRVLLSGLSHAGPPAWSPDGNALALKSIGENGESQVLVVDLSGVVKAQIPAGSPAEQGEYNLDGVSWSFDGEWLSFTTDGDRAVAISPKSGGNQLVVAQQKATDDQKSTEFLKYPCWSPSALNLVYVQSNMIENDILSFLYLARITN